MLLSPLLQKSLFIGSVFSLLFLCLGILSRLGKGQDILRFISVVYRGYSDSFFGILLGMMWGFIDGTVSAYILLFLWNFLTSWL
jgi:hypothetical protein